MSNRITIKIVGHIDLPTIVKKGNKVCHRKMSMIIHQEDEDECWIDPAGENYGNEDDPAMYEEYDPI